RHMVVERYRGQDARADAVDGLGSGWLGDSFLKTRGEVTVLSVAQQVLAPVEDERLLAQVGAPGEGELDRLSTVVGIPRHAVVERPGEGALGQRRVARHQGLKLLPADA